MKQLWAPWRMEYINTAPADTDKEGSGCPFCDAPASLDSHSGTISTEDPAKGSDSTPEPDKSKSPASLLLLYKGDSTSVIMNKYPYSNGHLMVSPLSHTADFTGLSPETSAELFHMTRIAVKILTECLNPDGFNVGMNLGSAAGAGISEHLHMHVVPRWNGDTNFMPVLSDARVISEHIDATYARLKPLFETT